MEKVVLKLVEVSRLEHAPWNPRGEDELALDNPRMVELVESVRSCGITQSLAVWDRGADVPMLVIAGNRRLEAARAAGMSMVPAIVYSGISDARAHEITRIENEMRCSVDPLRDAKLIEDMISNGLSQKEVAAHFSMSEAMVCRRRKLCGLVDEVREIAERRRNISTDALEHIALYPDETQRNCVSFMKRLSGRDGVVVRWKDVKWHFSESMRDLDGAKFDTSECVSCPLRTGAQADLWGEVDDDGKLGSCLKCECYERKLREGLADRVKDRVGPGVDIVDGAKDADAILYTLKSRAEFSERKSKKCPVAWWFYEGWKDELIVIWGPSLSKYLEIEEAEEAARAAERERERNIAEEEKAERAEAEAERKRIRDERAALVASMKDAACEIGDAYADLGHSSLVKAVKSGLLEYAFVNKKSSGVLAGVVAEWMEDRDYDCSSVIGLLEAFPAFAKKLGVTSEQMAAYAKARKALEAFDKKHP